MNSAVLLFSRYWYETVSVAEICRQAGLSNGVFYRYFPDKNKLFAEINKNLLNRFTQDLSIVGRYEDPVKNLHDFIHITVGLAHRYGPEVSIFREGQYRYMEQEKHLRLLYIDALSRVFRRTLSEAEYLYAISGIRFLATRNIYNQIEVDEKHLADLILNGVFPGGKIPELPEEDTPATPLFFNSTPPTRKKIATEGIRLFGEKGYHAAGVSEICLNAGVSVGTFYQHFNSKEEFLQYIIELIGHSARRFLTRETKNVSDLLSRELLGMKYFLHYFSKHPEFYTIVRQAEFVCNEWVGKYYNLFEKGYRKNLKIADPGKAGTTANFLMGLSHYLGIEVIFSDRVDDTRTLIYTLGKYLQNGLNLGGSL